MTPTKRTRATNGKWSFGDKLPRHEATRESSKERNPILLDREPCWRCGASDRKMCGHGL